MSGLKSIPRKEPWWVLAMLIGWSLIVFRKLLKPETVLFTTYDNIGALAVRKATLPLSFLGGWNDSILAGVPINLSINLTNFLMWILPLNIFANWSYAINILLASFFFYLFMRRKGLDRLPIAFGILMACYVGSNFTLIYDGRPGISGVLVFASAYLWLVGEAVYRKSPWWGILAGGAMGGMFLEQADLAVFFSLVLFPYGLFELWRANGKRVKLWLPVLLPMILVTGLTGIRPLLHTHSVNVTDAASFQDSNKAKWNYITQWSWPPQESADFILPGFTGWRSGEAQGPYRGVMGRSPEWKQTGKGLRNFKLESQYIGFIPIVLSLWAGLAAFRRKGSDANWLRFWFIASAVTLILAFGKFTPFYRIVYVFPFISEIQYPNRFLQVWQLAAAILAAFGVQWVLEKSSSKAGLKRLTCAATGAFVVLAFCYFNSLLGVNDSIAAFSKEGWGTASDSLARLRIRAIGTGTGLAFILTVFLWLVYRSVLTGKWLAVGTCALFAVTAADALQLHKRYITTLDPGLIEKNQVVNILQGKSPQRAYLMDQGSFYGSWLTYLFPYFNVDTFNYSTAARVPDEYKAFLQTFGRNLIPMWQYSAVGYVLAPAQVWGQLQANPAIKDRFSIEYAHRIKPTASQLAVEVIPGTQASPGTHCIIRFKGPAQRFRLISDWEFVEHSQQLKRLAAADFPPLQRVVVDPAYRNRLGEPPKGAAQDSVKITRYQPTRVLLKISSERTAILRCADKFDPGWTATINGEPAEVIRCDYLFRGIKVPPGLHEVELEYTPSLAPLAFQCTGMMLSLFALGILLVQSRSKQPEQNGSNRLGDKSDS